MIKLARDFYLNEDVLTLSKTLLGKVLVSQIDGKRTAGIIVETEAYKAPEDKASHAYNNRRTMRTATMFAKGGIAYVYLCYGMHHLFNIVTGPQEIPHAILIRALEPIQGIEHMLKRRKLLAAERKLTAGPAVLTQAMGITTAHNGCSLSGLQVWVEDHGIRLSPQQILATPRIGISYAQEYVARPWRFIIKNNKWVSVLP